MDLAYVSIANPNKVGGVENTTSVWLRYLSERGVDVTIIGYGDDDVSEFKDGIQFYQLADPRPAEEITRLLRKIDADVVFTESGWTDLAIDAANELGIGSVLNINTVQGEMTDKYANELRPTKFTTCSQYVKQWAGEIWKAEATVVYPAIDFDFYDIEDQRREDICMVTPVEEKGGRNFRQIAEQMSDRSFAVKQGWSSIRNEDGGWDKEQFLMMAQAWNDDADSISEEDIPEDKLPEDVGFSDLSNVTRVPDRAILDLYRRAEVLVDPPMWRQAFSRVTLEAMWNGIPVVTCDRGGVTEAGGGAALLVDDHDDPDAYVEKLRKLEDPERYEAFSRMARERAERYRERQPERIEKLRDVLEAAAAAES